MEKLDLEKITLKETGLFNSAYAFCSLFRNNNITTVAQVLDEQKMFELSTRCNGETRRQLSGFIALLKFKYLNIPIAKDKILNLVIKFDSSILGDTFGLTDKSYEPEFFGKYNIIDNIGMLSNLGFSRKDYILMSERLKIYGKANGLPRNIKFIDFLKEYVKYCDERTAEIINLLLASCENTKVNEERSEVSSKEESTDISTISVLKDQLANLMTMRDNLDSQISFLQQKIGELTNNVSKEGGARK